MKIDREQIEAHARQRLQGEPHPAEPRGRLSDFKRFIKLETDRLRMRHRFGLGGLEIASARSYQVDQVVAHACRLALAEAEPGGAAGARRVRGGRPRRLRAGGALPVLRRGPPVPAPGPRGRGRATLRRAGPPAPLGRRPHRRPQLPDPGGVPRGGPRRPPLAHRPRRGAPRGRRHGRLRGARPGPRQRHPARPQDGRGLSRVAPRGRGRAPRPRRRGGVRPGAERQGGRGRSARPPRGPLGGPGPPRQPRPGRRPRRGSSLRAGAPGGPARLRLPPPRTRGGPLRHRPQDGRAHPGPAARGGEEPRLRGQPGPARLGAVHARLLPARLRPPRRLPQRPAAPARGSPPPPLRRPHEAPPRPRLRGARRPAPRQVGGAASRAATGLLSAFAAAQAEGVPLSDELALAIRERLSLVGRELRESKEAAAVFVDVLRWRGRVGPRPARHARDGFPGPLPAGVRPGELPRPARLLPPLHGGRAHAAGDRGDRRGRRGHGGRGAALRPRPRRGRGRRPALPRDAAPRRRQGPRGRPLRAGGAHGPAGLRPARARRAGHGGRGLPRRRPPRDVPGLAAPRPDRGQRSSPRSPSAWGASTG